MRILVGQYRQIADGTPPRSGFNEIPAAPEAKPGFIEEKVFNQMLSQGAHYWDKAPTSFVLNRFSAMVFRRPRLLLESLALQTHPGSSRLPHRSGLAGIFPFWLGPAPSLASLGKEVERFL